MLLVESIPDNTMFVKWGDSSGEGESKIVASGAETG